MSDSLTNLLLGRRRRQAIKDVNKLSLDTGRAISKQQTWQQLGSMALPFVTRMAMNTIVPGSGEIPWVKEAVSSALLSYIGGEGARSIAAKTEGGKIPDLKTGSNHLAQGSRDIIREEAIDMMDMLGKRNMSSAVTRGVTAGARALGKEGLKEMFGGVTPPDKPSVWSKERMFGWSPKTATEDTLTGAPLLNTTLDKTGMKEPLTREDIKKFGASGTKGHFKGLEADLRGGRRQGFSTRKIDDVSNVPLSLSMYNRTGSSLLPFSAMFRDYDPTQSPSSFAYGNSFGLRGG